METASIPITVQGRHLMRGDKRFLVRGIVYQRYDAVKGPHDLQSHDSPEPITDEQLPRLRHDIALLKELGLNTILVYSIDNTKPRGQAMKLLEDAGIYVLITLARPTACIRRNDPHASYNRALVAEYFLTVDVMSPYPNSLGIFAQYDLINNISSLQCAPIVAAVVRDLKQYMNIKHQSTGQRQLPVGYGGMAGSTEIDRTFLKHLRSQKPEDRIDFWTCKCFPILEDSEMNKANPDDKMVLSSARCRRDAADQFKELLQQSQNAPMPMFISEYSAIGASQPRKSKGLDQLFSAELLNVFSGCCMYEMWNGGNQYGLASLLPPGFEESAEKDVRERRETEFGTLVLYEDFFHYKATLDAPEDESVATSFGPVGGEKEEEEQQDLMQKFEIPRVVPESCVDWDTIS